MSAIEVLSDSHWHALRGKHIGGSEVAALFGESTYLTHFELWHRKRGSLPAPDFEGNDRIFWGTILEPAIAMGAAKKTGWNVRKVHRYMTHPSVPGMGCSADYEIVAHDRGPGLLSIKNADWLVYKRWEEGEPPLAYELQLQHEMACSGREWGAMAVLVGGNDLKLFEYHRRPKTVARIEDAVTEFWASIKEGQEPKPDFERDGAAIAKLYSDVIKDKVVDMSDDNRLAILCAEYLDAATEAKKAEGRKDAAKAEMMTKIGDAEKIIVGGFTISAGTVAGATVSYERKPYRNFRCTPRKEPK